MPYHCAGLRVLAGASGQDRRLRTGHGFRVALLEPQSQETERDAYSDNNEKVDDNLVYFFCYSRNNSTTINMDKVSSVIYAIQQLQ